MKHIQKIGGALFVPAMLFAFAGIMVGLSLIFQNEQIWGEIATQSSLWGKFWSVISAGSWTVFMQLPLLFSLAIPITLSKSQPGKAAIASLVSYLTFQYFLNQILILWGGTFGVDISAEVGAASGLTTIANVVTLDTGIIGSLVVSGLVTFLHNKFFTKELPEWLSIFRGTPLVVAVAFFAMIPLAFGFAWIWPSIQNIISNLQGFFLNSGSIGIWVYAFLMKILMPTGLHHLVYAPITYDNLVVQGGTSAYWATNIQNFMNNSQSLKEMYPIGFSLSGMGKVFGALGIAPAFYFTAKPERRKKVLALMIPVSLTAILTGITEPFDFTFLFTAPVLYLVFALLDATLQAVSFSLGIVGDFGGGLINWAAINWIPLGYYHWQTYLIQIIVGLVFAGIFFVVFVTLIRKFDLKTPGREIGVEETKLYTKDDFKEKKEKGDSTQATDIYANSGKSKDEIQAAQYLELLGGKENIDSVTNCATRLRLTVNDLEPVKEDSHFMDVGAHGVYKNGKNYQIIVGMSVEYVRNEFEKLLNN